MPTCRRWLLLGLLLFLVIPANVQGQTNPGPRGNEIFSTDLAAKRSCKTNLDKIDTATMGHWKRGVISPVPAKIVAKYNLDTKWYNKYIDAWGHPVLGSRNLSDATLLKAKAQLGTLLCTNPRWPVPELNHRKIRLVIIARGEKMSSIPEVYALFGTSLDDRYWGGFGATEELPITAATEANLMDNYGKENVFVHEFGHSLADMALQYIDPNFLPELNNAWNNAQAKGLWSNTYANTNISEYWAEGIQTYFDINREGPVGGDGVHNNVNTRAELYTHDRPLYNLFERIYRGKTLP